MIGFQANPGTGLFEFLDRIRSNDGVLVLILIALIWFCCYLLSKAVWKVWRTAMKAKDQEIARLTQERDRYQSIVFERLLGPGDFWILTQKEWPEDEGGGGNSSPDKVH